MAPLLRDLVKRNALVHPHILRHAQNSLRDDVAQDLVGAAGDADAWRLARSTRPARAGFIHIPYLTEQRDRLEAEGRIDKGLAAMSQAELFRGVEIILRALAAK